MVCLGNAQINELVHAFGLVLLFRSRSGSKVVVLPAITNDTPLQSSSSTRRRNSLPQQDFYNGMSTRKHRASMTQKAR